MKLKIALYPYTSPHRKEHFCPYPTQLREHVGATGRIQGGATTNACDGAVTRVCDGALVVVLPGEGGGEDDECGWSNGGWRLATTSGEDCGCDTCVDVWGG